MISRTIRVVVLGIVFPGLIVFAQEGESPKPIKELKVDVELVTVDVSVRDPQGRLVRGLDQEHFQAGSDRDENLGDFTVGNACQRVRHDRRHGAAQR